MINIFRKIYNNNEWNGSESISGCGSTLSETENIRKLITDIILEYKIHTLLDIPCGDFWWFSHIKILENINYTGWDILPELIQTNKFKYPLYNFEIKNITEDIPEKNDLIVCRDLLVHLSNDNILKSLNNIKFNNKNSLLLSTTFNISTHPENIIDGAWRQINLQGFPFNLGIPLKIIDDSVNWKYKKIALWRL